MNKAKRFILVLFLGILAVFLAANCSISGSSESSGSAAGEGSGDVQQQDIEEILPTASWKAYNDCVTPTTGSDPNVTHYDWGNPTGLLKNFDDGTGTAISVTMSSDNVTGWNPSGTPQAGTPAYEIFGGIVNIDEIASYNSSSLDMYYEATFSGLDPTGKYAFVSTANRNDVGYEGEGTASRWTKFTICGADTYTNASSSGVIEVSEDVVKMNTGYNTINGNVVAWTDITASDGSFSVRSENVGAAGPGEQYKAYGLQAFLFVELSE